MKITVSLVDSKTAKFKKTTTLYCTYLEAEQRIAEMNAKIKSDNYWTITVINA